MGSEQSKLSKKKVDEKQNGNLQPAVNEEKGNLQPAVNEEKDEEISGNLKQLKLDEPTIEDSLVDPAIDDEARKQSKTQQFDESFKFLTQYTSNYVEAKRIAQYLIQSPEDLDFFNKYVKMMRSEGKYDIEVTKVFRIHGFHQHADEFVKNHRILMHGVNKQNMFDLVLNGFNEHNGCSSIKSFFGRGFLFADCSTKAFNFASSPNAYQFERKADTGEIQPELDQEEFILVCDVALGRRMNSCKNDKSPIHNSYDSRTTIPLFVAKKDIVIEIPFTKEFPRGVTLLPYDGFESNREIMDYNEKTTTSHLESYVYTPDQISMLWLLAVKRID